MPLRQRSFASTAVRVSPSQGILSGRRAEAGTLQLYGEGMVGDAWWQRSQGGGAAAKPQPGGGVPAGHFFSTTHVLDFADVQARGVQPGPLPEPGLGPQWYGSGGRTGRLAGRAGFMAWVQTVQGCQSLRLSAHACAGDPGGGPARWDSG